MLNTAAIYQTENAAIAIQAMEVLFPHPGFLQYDFAIRVKELWKWYGKEEWKKSQKTLSSMVLAEDGYEALMKVSGVE